MSNHKKINYVVLTINSNSTNSNNYSTPKLNFHIM